MGRGNEQLTAGSRSRKSCREREAGSRSHEAVGTIKQREGAEHFVSAKDNEDRLGWNDCNGETPR